MQGRRDAIERLKDKLYSRTEDIKPHERSDFSGSVGSVERTWEKNSPLVSTEVPSMDTMRSHPAKKSSGPFIILLASLLFFIVSLAIAGFIFLRGTNVVSSGNIDMQIVGPSLVDGGKEAALQIIINNHNTTALQLADLILDYPEGTRSATNVTQALSQVRTSVGDIPAGGSIKKTASAILFGEEGSTRTIKATLEYRVAGSNAIFVKESTIDLTIGSSPVTLTVDGPTDATAGKTATFTVQVSSNATTPIQNVVLLAQYPFGFTVTATSPETNVGDNLWQLGTLNPRSTKTITITGTIEGQDGEERVFRFAIGSQQDATDVTLKVPYVTIPHSITIKRPFISGSLAINGVTTKTVAVYDGKEVHGVISWQNNLDTEVRDLRISAQLSGNAYDKSSVSVARGFWRSNDATMLWDSSQDSSLSSVAPGETGQVEFTLVPSTGNGVLKNPEIDVTVNLSASRLSEGQVPESISSAINTTLTLATPVALAGGLFHFNGSIKNTGPMPPKADQETTYSVVWTVKNPSNTIANARVTVPLPPTTRFITSGTPTEDVSYNSSTNTVTWNVGELRAGVGYGLPGRGVSFQVGFTPSLAQVGSAPAVLGDSILTGEDRFAQTNVNSTVGSMTTRLTFDTGFQNGMEVITK